MTDRIRLAALAAAVLSIMFAATPAVAQMMNTAGPSISLKATLDSSAAPAGAKSTLAVTVEVPDGWHINAHKPNDDYLVPTTLELALPEGMKLGRMAYPQAKSYTVQGFEEQLAVYGGTFIIGAEIHVGPEVAPGIYQIPTTLRYQACNDTQCMMPAAVKSETTIEVVAAGTQVTPVQPDLFSGLAFEGEAPSAPAPATQVTATQSAAPAPAQQSTNWREALSGFKVAGEASGYLSTSEFLNFLDEAESGQRQAGLFEQKALWLVILLVIAGGLLLNLTPCVLPLMPINVAIIGAGAKAGSKGRGFLLGMTYGLGMAVSYGVLGLVVILGLSNTFGALNSTVWFNAVIAGIFVLLALAMFDVFLLDFSRLQGRLGTSRLKGGTFVAAGLMGVISALLAGACVAPVILSTIVYAQDQYARGNSWSLLLPFLIGLGMGLPWPFAGAGLSFLPKPGRWMERVKYAFGVIILVLAAYYGYLAWSLFNDRYLADREAVAQSAQAAQDEEGWHTDLATALAQAEKEGKPLLIDFWATWCKNCMTMNKTTLKDQAVLTRLDDYVKVKYQAEDPSDPAVREVMEHFNIIGLPTYIVLEPAQPDDSNQDSLEAPAASSS